ncbi:MAG: triose-phosphate isomerase [Tetragenococcus koreensis]|nr:triose-phosphate isomerase [Atopostipes sp.]MDN6733309.1 triose-phosphate isomerase [Tetragenococcus koreensis]MDN6735843.1 triose-phosphate isomerase [Tetragenococcus koreensis]
MTNRKPLVAMTWTMRQNKSLEARTYAKQLRKLLGEEQQIDLVLFPSMGTIYVAAEELKNSNIQVGAQTISSYQYGQYSGEYSIESLLDIGGKYIEIGHWERRMLFGETEAMINQKVLLALKNQVQPILCVGEQNKETDLQDMDYHKVYLEIKRQLFNGLLDVEKNELANIIIAYTPRWAVGQSLAAPRPHIHKVAKLIRKIVDELYGEKSSDNVRIIYGGTVSLENTNGIVEIEGQVQNLV